jgi:hypothetical protein
MTKAQAAELKAQWNQQVDPQPCEHFNLELEEVVLGTTCLCTKRGLPLSREEDRRGPTHAEV